MVLLSRHVFLAVRVAITSPLSTFRFLRVSAQKDNHLLGKFELGGIPPTLRGELQIEVTFEIDSKCWS